MEGEFPVQFAGNEVGIIQIQKSGMYYLLKCQCSLPNRRLFRLYTQSYGQPLSLGILVPEENHYTLTTRVLSAKLSSSATFYVLQNDKGQDNDIILSVDKPIACLKDLDRYRLVKKTEAFCIRRK